MFHFYLKQIFSADATMLKRKLKSNFSHENVKKTAIKNSHSNVHCTGLLNRIQQSLS